MSNALAWFRRDLRLDDNPAWAAATRAAGGGELTALFVLDPALFDKAGSFRRAALAGHLRSLDRSLADGGGRLRLEVGDPTEIVPALARELDATVVANADVSPYSRRRDQQVHTAVGDRFTLHWGSLVHPPGTVLTKAGTLSRVFTPFWKQWSTVVAEPWAEPSEATVAGVAGPGWSGLEGVAPADDAPGEQGAAARLGRFLDSVDRYPDQRDLPAVDGTSQLSADLRFGTVSPRHVAEVVGTATDGRRAFVRQLAWRDWYAHLLWETPAMVSRAMNPALNGVAWLDDDERFAAWRDGRTGYPIVDAGMRQLRATGWMHNRVRMITASFLVKDLLIDWRRGERWFRHLLVDADVSQNVGNWQWVAGTGPDAAPYFRVFNPVLQGRKFDGDGDYVRRWVPELAGLDRKWIHTPWEAPGEVLAAAGLTLDRDYPRPVVDHAAARDAAIAAYEAATAAHAGGGHEGRDPA